MSAIWEAQFNISDSFQMMHGPCAERGFLIAGPGKKTASAATEGQSCP